MLLRVGLIFASLLLAVAPALSKDKIENYRKWLKGKDGGVYNSHVLSDIVITITTGKGQNRDKYCVTAYDPKTGEDRADTGHGERCVELSPEQIPKQVKVGPKFAPPACPVHKPACQYTLGSYYYDWCKKSSSEPMYKVDVFFGNAQGAHLQILSAPSSEAPAGC